MNAMPVIDTPAIPDRRNEAWHYGDPRRFTVEGLEPAPSTRPAPPQAAELALQLCAAGAACFELSGVDARPLGDTALPDGVSAEALGPQSALSEPILALRRAEAADYFAVQHDALRGSGCLVRADRNSGPAELHVFQTGAPDGSVGAGTVVVTAGAHANLSVYVHLSGGGDAARSLHSGLILVEAAEGARVSVTEVQHSGARADVLLRTRAVVGRDASFTSQVVQLGGLNVRSEVFAELSAAGSSARMVGAYIADGRQRFDFLTHQNHQAPHATSNLLYKGALLGRARASYQGMITVAEHAQRTDAYQSNRTLVLSKSARADSSPQLEIGANDVRCTHGSTVSNVGEEELFYLQSRGLPREHARRLLVQAFLGEVVDQLASEPLRKYINDHVLERYR